MAALIAVSDLTPFIDNPDEVKLQAMIDDALATAIDKAPCIADPEFTKAAVAKAILRGALLRWAESGSGALQATTKAAGPYSETQTFDNRQTRRTMFYPSEIEDLQALCAPVAEKRAAFSVDLTPWGD